MGAGDDVVVAAGEAGSTVPEWLTPEVFTVVGLSGLGVVASCNRGALKASTYLSFLLLLAAAFLMFWQAGNLDMVLDLPDAKYATLPFYLICGGVAIPAVHFACIILAGGANTTAGIFKSSPTVIYQQAPMVAPPTVVAAKPKRRLMNDLDLLWHDTLKVLPEGCIKRRRPTLRRDPQPVDIMMEQPNDPESWDPHTLESIFVMFTTLLGLTLYMYYVSREASNTVTSSKTQYIEKKPPEFAKGHRNDQFSRPRIRVV